MDDISFYSTDRAGNAIRCYSAAGTAKMVRQMLKGAWPAVKFTVRTRRYSGGASIDVAYVDGPARSAVVEACDFYCRSSFDGMTDSTDYRGPVLLAVTDQPMPVLAQWGVDCVIVAQQLSPERTAEMLALIEAAGPYHRADAPGLTVVDTEVGHFEGFGLRPIALQLHAALAG